MEGYRIIEVPVSHHPRKFGKSKYNIRNRMIRSFVDLLAVRWMKHRASGTRSRKGFKTGGKRGGYGRDEEDMAKKG